MMTQQHESFTACNVGTTDAQITRFLCSTLAHWSAVGSAQLTLDVMWTRGWYVSVARGCLACQPRCVPCVPAMSSIPRVCITPFSHVPNVL